MKADNWDFGYLAAKRENDVEFNQLREAAITYALREHVFKALLTHAADALEKEFWGDYSELVQELRKAAE